jgi:hypothetical protein
MFVGLTDTSQCLAVVSTSQSTSVRQSTQRLFGRSQMLVPVGFVVHIAVPQDVTQVLAVLPVVLHTWPVGHCASMMHCTQLPAGSIIIPAGRMSQILSVGSSAQSISVKHPTQRLFGRSQTLLPVGFVVQFAVTQAVVACCPSCCVSPSDVELSRREYSCRPEAASPGGVVYREHGSASRWAVHVGQAVDSDCWPCRMLVPVGFVVHTIPPHITPSGTPPPPAGRRAARPAAPPVPLPPVPPVPVEPPEPVAPPVPAVPVDVVVLESSPPQAT